MKLFITHNHPWVVIEQYTLNKINIEFFNLSILSQVKPIRSTGLDNTPKQSLLRDSSNKPQGSGSPKEKSISASRPWRANTRSTANDPRRAPNGTRRLTTGFSEMTSGFCQFIISFCYPDSPQPNVCRRINATIQTFSQIKVEKSYNECCRNIQVVPLTRQMLY